MQRRVVAEILADGVIDTIELALDDPLLGLSPGGERCYDVSPNLAVELISPVFTSVPEPMALLILNLMAKDPENRIQTASEVTSRLQKISKSQRR